MTVSSGSTGARSYKAHYAKKVYTVDFETNGGTAVASQSVEHGDKVDQSKTDTSKDGYTLEGWFTDEQFTTEFNLNEAVTGSLKLYAKWEENEAKFSYLAGKGGSVDPKSEIVKVINGKAAGSTATAADGYEFVCWTDIDGKTVSEDAAFIPDKTGGKYVSASYTANFRVIPEYPVTYDLDGGALADGVTNPEKYTKNDTFKLNNPTKDGAEFIGWTGTGLTESTKEVTVPVGSTGARSYKAHYTKIVYTVDFDTNGGTEVASQSVEYGDKEDQSKVNTSKDGYTLEGWYEDKELTKAFDLSTKITEPKTLYAKWKENEATFKYVFSKGGSVSSKSETVKVITGTAAGSTATAADGYEFVGWTDIDGNAVSVNATFVPEKSDGKYVSASYVANFEKKEVPPEPVEPGESIVSIIEAPELTYTGKEQTAFKDTDEYTVKNGNATNAGKYKAVITPKDGFVWADGTSGSKEVSFTIAKATLTAEYAGETIEWYEKPKMEVKVTGFVNGETADTAKDYAAPEAKAPTYKPHKKYSVTPYGGSAANYTFDYVSGKLTVNCKTVMMAKVKAGKSKATISWTKVPGAKGYKIYGSKCGKCGKCGKPETEYKLIGTVKGQKLKTTIRKLQKASYKFYVVAYRVQDGKTIELSRSPNLHVIINNAVKGRTNPTGINVNKTSVSINKGETTKVKGSIVCKKKPLKKDHAATVRYKSSDSHIAKVDKSGKITGKKKGECKIYVYTQNGIWKAVNVTVK